MVYGNLNGKLEVRRFYSNSFSIVSAKLSFFRDFVSLKVLPVYSMLARVIFFSFISIKFPNSLILPPRQHLSLTVAVKANTLAKGSEHLELLAYKFPLSRDKSTNMEPERAVHHLKARQGEACAKCISNAIQFPFQSSPSPCLSAVCSCQE